MDSKLTVYYAYYTYIITVDTKIFALCTGLLVKGMIKMH